MSESKQISYEITAEGSSFTQTMQSLASSASGATSLIKSSFQGLGGALESFQKPFLAFAAVVAGGAMFKDAISFTNKLNGEALGLSKALGITGSEAAALRTALGDIGSDSDTYIGAFRQFAKQLKSNEEGLKAMGLQTRDSNGHLRDSKTLFTEAIQVVGNYKPGLDQATAAMTLFGKGIDDVMTLQKYNNGVLDGARQKNEELGLSMTKEGVEATRAYKAAMNDVGDVLDALKNQLGSAVMPVFTQLGEWFAEVGPAAVSVFRVAVNSVSTVFQGIVGLARSLVEVLKGLLNPILQVGNALDKLARGDMTGASKLMMTAFDGWGKSIVDHWEKAGDGLKRTAKDVANIWGKGSEVGKPKGGSGEMGDFNKTNKKEGGKSDKSAMSNFEAELEALKVATTKKGLVEGQYREYSKAEEAKFWRDKAAMSNLSVEDRAKAAKKASEAELAVLKQGFEAKVAHLQAESAAYRNNIDAKIAIEQKIQGMYAQGSKEYEAAQQKINELQRAAAEQTAQVERVKSQAKRDAALSGIAQEEQDAQQQLQMELISQEQYLASMQQFEQRKYQISHDALQAKLAEQEKDPDKSPVEIARIHAEVEQLEQQHQIKIGQLKNAAQADKLKPLGNIFKASEGAMGNAISGMLMKTQNMQQAMRNIYKSMAQSVTGEIGKMIAAKASMFIKERLFAALGIQTDGAKAAAGAAASQASIPIVGPGMALASAATMLSTVLGFSGKLPSFSAAGGFDIPSTVNPIVQTHASEMILPAKYADVIRSLGDGGGAAGGESHFHVHALDVRDFEGFLRRGGGDALVKSLTERRRNGAF